MSQQSQPAQPIHQTIVIENRSNGLGTAGFVISLVGFLTCGLICPLGMLISFFGMFSRPRGTAIAGFVFGVIGSAWLWLVGLGLIATATGVGAAARQAAQDAAKKAEAAKAAAVAPGINILAAPDAAAAAPAAPVDAAPVAEQPAAEMPPLPAAAESQPTTDPVPQPFASDPPKPKKPEREARTWQDASGQFKVEATLKSMASGKVKLIKADGTEISVPVERLSDDDQAYIKAQMK